MSDQTANETPADETRAAETMVSRRRVMRLGAASTVGGLAAAGVVASASPAAAASPGNWRVVNKGESIQAALNAAAGEGGGVVCLAAGEHKVSSMLTMGANITLRGAGASTVLKATVAMDFVLKLEKTSHGSAVEDLRIFGQGRAGGIHVSTFGSSSFSGNDSYVSLRNLFVQDTNRQGVLVKTREENIDGERTVREVRMHNVVVLRPKQSHGIEFRGVDSILSDCTVATAGKPGDNKLHGFVISGSNNRLTGCKAFYNSSCGFYITGSRNQLSACQAQDNFGDGFRLTNSSDVALSACCSDSNALVGLRLSKSRAISCDSFSSFSRNGQSTHSYGIRVQDSHDSRITGISRANRTNLRVDPPSSNIDTSGVLDV